MDKSGPELYEKSYFKMLYEMSYWKAEVWVAAKKLDGTVVISFVTVSMDKPFHLSEMRGTPWASSMSGRWAFQDS